MIINQLFSQPGLHAQSVLLDEENSFSMIRYAV